MCTASLIASPHDHSLRLLVNRDESRTRADASPPRWRSIPGARAIWPADGDAGGTWIAASDRGLLLTLLNFNHLPHERPALPPPDTLVSRGNIIPSLIHHPAADDAARALADLPLERFAPFRLLAIDLLDSTTPRVFESSWDHARLRTNAFASAPICFASSGLGDALAQPRLDLFEDMVAAVAPDQLRQAQDLFHAHAWPDRRHISVMMSREDACTVSITDVTLTHPPGQRPRVRMGYRPVLQPLVLAQPQALAPSPTASA